MFANSQNFPASNINLFFCILVFFNQQDWDFPHFSSTTNLKLPGCTMKGISINLPPWLSLHNSEINIQGKWVNYSVLLGVMILDLYQWKNQIYYKPHNYGQYADKEGENSTVLN